MELARPPPEPGPSPTWNSTALLLARSALLPASAMTMLGLACLCNSFTQFLARANVSWGDRARASTGRSRHSAQGCSLEKLALAELRCLRCHHPEDSGETPPNTRGNVPTPHSGTKGREARENLYCVGDVVDHDGSLGPPIVHGGQAVIPLLSSCVPDLKLDCCVVQADGLCEEGRWKREGSVTRCRGAEETPSRICTVPSRLWHLEARKPPTRRPEQPSKAGGAGASVSRAGWGLHWLYRPSQARVGGEGKPACTSAISGALSEGQRQGAGKGNSRRNLAPSTKGWALAPPPPPPSAQRTGLVPPSAPAQGHRWPSVS